MPAYGPPVETLPAYGNPGAAYDPLASDIPQQATLATDHGFQWSPPGLYDPAYWSNPCNWNPLLKCYWQTLLPTNNDIAQRAGQVAQGGVAAAGSAAGAAGAATAAAFGQGLAQGIASLLGPNWKAGLFVGGVGFVLIIVGAVAIFLEV